MCDFVADNNSESYCGTGKEIPNMLKIRLVEGPNEDPLSVNSYRGITLSSVV